MKNNQKILFSLFIVLLIFSNCESDSQLHEVTRRKFALGTIVKITVLDTDKTEARKAIDQAFNEINRIGSLFYKGNPKSPIYRFNHSKQDTLSLSEEIINWIFRSQKLARKTKGSFDITVGKIASLYTFDQENFQPPKKKKVDSLLNYVGYRKIAVDTSRNIVIKKDQRIKIITGGSAKGYAVDRAIKSLDTFKLAGALVSAGGDLRATPREDKKKWTVGIRHPRRKDAILGTIEIEKGAVATSGDYEQFVDYNGKRYHHIISPKSGYPARASRSTTIIAPTAELADALSTGLFILGPEQGLQQIQEFSGCEALWVDSEGNYHSTKKFNDYLKNKLK